MASEDVANTIVNPKEIRQMLGLSVKEFSIRYGFRQSDVKKWEAGVSAPCGVERTFLIVLERIPDEVTQALSIC
jgi:DNA-binding transcriptional regulator YiaG